MTSGTFRARLRSTSAARIGAAVVMIAACTFMLLTPFPGSETFTDQRIYRETAASMRGGAGYYDAMESALVETNGPPGSVRAYREPLPFLVWRLLPNEHAVWALFVVLAGITGFLLLGATKTPWAPPIAVLYLLRLARPLSGGWHDQFLIVELWVVPAAAACLYFHRRARPGAAAAAAGVATLVRELAAGLLVGGVVATLAARRSVRPWVVALVTVAALLAVHLTSAGRHLTTGGSEAPLWGTGHPPETVTNMIAWSLPNSSLTGWVIWLLAAWRLGRDRDLLLTFGPLAVVPALGLFVGRVYWGFLVSPLLLFWAAEAIQSLTVAMAQHVGRRRAAHA
jgi:hypothetical protein